MIQHGPKKTVWNSAPIDPTWILEGDPQASSIILSETADRSVLTVQWKCTPGKFNWHYDYDEPLYVLSGEAVIRDLSNQREYRLTAGSSMLFPRYSSAQWTVTRTITKIAVVHSPLSPKLLALQAVWRALKGTRKVAGALT